MHPSNAPDHGPLYTETNWDAFIREPFNAVTAAAFLIIGIVWLYRLRGSYDKHRFVTGCLILLLVGGVGGTLFHGLRTSRWFLLMDVLPILLIAVGLTFWLWSQVLGRVWPAFAMLAGFFGIQSVLWQTVPRRFAPNISYALVALIILVPLIFVLRRDKWKNSRQIALVAGFFAVGVLFRALDPVSASWMSVGTHWLWHSFSAIAVWFLIDYLVNRRHLA